MIKSVFNIKSPFKPAGSQPEAIKSLVAGLKSNMRHQTLLGVTGSGKTFTMANVIAKVGKSTLVIAHNKTLAAQLAQEYKNFFPKNAVHYFVSHYDFYQPEAYLPITDTYIEKEAMINEEVERLRHAATRALLTRRDVVVVASVSCIYGLGSPEEYEKVNLKLSVGKEISRGDFIRALVGIHYERTNADLSPGFFRALGNAIEIVPANERELYRFEIENGCIASIGVFDLVSRVHLKSPETVFIFPAKHFITDKEKMDKALKNIRSELKERLVVFEKAGKLLEAERLKRRTNYDLVMMKEIGYTNGIENYSCHLSGKLPGEPPDTLLSYFPKDKNGKPDFLTIIDESHVTVPQIGGMYSGDASRKKTLIDHGFRLPSATDNRPLKFEEFMERVGQIIFTSATPAEYEREISEKIVEQVIRPTGLIDPQVILRPITPSAKYEGQVKNFIKEAEADIRNGGRVIATTLTKKMAEDLSAYLKESGIKAEYLHSEIKTIDRITILTDFRKGKFDCLVGVNLLREGLDLPEVSLIGILDADKEGFLRSETSLIQIIGRAARNVLGRVIIYGDRITGSMERAVSETERRRKLQLVYNKKHGIVPKTIIKNIKDITEEIEGERRRTAKRELDLDIAARNGDVKSLLREKERLMSVAVKELDFESAAIIRDEIKFLLGKDKNSGN